MGRRRKAWLMNGNGRRAERPGFYVEYRDRQGERPIHRTRHFLTKQHAAEFCRRYNARLDLQAIGQVPEIGIIDAADEFLRECTGLSPKTIGDYQTATGRLAGHARDVPVCRVTADHVDKALRAGLKKRSPATAAKLKRSLRRFFRWAMKRGYAVCDPTADSGVVLPSKSVRERPVINDADVATIVGVIDDPDCRLMVWLAATTGLDRGVIEGLHAGQIDFDAGLIRARRPKTGKIVVVPMHPTLAIELRRRCGLVPRGNPLLAVARRQSRKSDWFRRARESAGRPDIVFRDLRAYATSRLLNAHVPMAEVSRALGHSSISTTQAHYLLPSPALAQALGALPIPGYPSAAESKTG